MTLKKKFLFFALALFVLLLPSITMAHNDMDGFRGIKWGTAYTDVQNIMKPTRHDVVFGGVYFCQRTNDPLKIGSATLKSIEYGFWQGQLMCVGIRTDGYSDFVGLKQALDAKLGKAYQDNEYIEDYSWRAKSYSATLEYDQFNRKGSLVLISTEVIKKAAQWQKQKASEGAGDL